MADEAKKPADGESAAAGSGPATGGGSTTAGKAAPASSKDRKSPPDSQVVPDGDGPRRKGAKLDAKHLRTQLARVVGLVFLLLALVLALAALFIALEANADNAFVKFVLDLATSIDLGIFDLDNPIKKFGGANGAVKEALLNYGLGAVVYLVVGRILERIIRP